MLPAAHRVRRGDDFRNTIRQGRRCGGRLLVAHAVTGTTPAPARVGFVVSRAVGNAVTRNHVKRQLRHLAHDRLDRLPPSTVVIVRALPACAQASYRDLGEALDRALDRLGLGSAA